MAIPEYPITRREQYLDAIATNDTSVLPAEPITRTEQYLDAIARNGGGGGGGSSTLSGLTDVDISNPTDGQMLVYNAESGKWENGAGGGGGALIVHVSHDEQEGIYTLDKTWQEIADAILVGPVLLIEEDDYNHNVGSSSIQSVSSDGGYYVQFGNGGFSADTPNGYPYYQAD